MRFFLCLVILAVCVGLALSSLHLPTLTSIGIGGIAGMFFALLWRVLED